MGCLIYVIDFIEKTFFCDSKSKIIEMPVDNVRGFV